SNSNAIDLSTVAGDITVANGAGVDVDAGAAALSLTAGGVGSAITLNANASIAGQPINLQADHMAFAPTASINAAGSDVNLTVVTPGTEIRFGAADAPNVLGLLDSELDTITAGTLRIGSGLNGSITFDAAITAPATWNTLSLI